MKHLTAREQEILDLLLKLERPKEIGGKLGISYGTVLFHQNNIYRKLDVRSSNELLLKCLPIKEQKKDTFIELDVPENLIFTFYDNHSKWYNGDLHWLYPMRAKNSRIMEGDIYSINCSFSSDVKIGVLKVVIIDDSFPEDVKKRRQELSAWQNLAINIEPNIMYNASYKMCVNKSADSELPEANQFVLYTGAVNGSGCEKIPQPTLTFEKLEIRKYL